MTRHSSRLRAPRDTSAKDLIFGRNPVLELMRSAPTSIEKVFIADQTQGTAVIASEARSAGIPLEVVPRAMLDAMTGGANHQGIAARAKPYDLVAVEDLMAQAPRLLIALDGILDPQNLGAIIRAAEVLGAGGMILPRDRSAGVTPAAIRASSGAAFHLPIAQVVNLVRALEEAKSKDYWIVGLDADGPSRFQQLPVLDRVVLVVGGEGRGMRPLVARACDFIVSIPVRGRVGSLNAATAAAIALHELAARLAC